MKLIIMDYNSAKVWYKSIDKGMDSEQCEELVTELGFNLDEVEWMTAPEFEYEEICN